MWENLNSFYWQNKNVKIYCEDVLSGLKKLPDESIQMSMCSPPYWGLRNYQVEGQYGLETTPQDYINNMKNVFKEIYRVLKKDGTCWINIGDTYCSQPPGNKFNDKYQIGDGLYGRLIDRNAIQENNAKNIISGRFDKQKYNGKNSIESGRGRGGDYKNKCMLMMPERFAFMMIDLGFILRNKIKWIKQIYIHKQSSTMGSIMPSSVKDRFNESGEELYFFTKSKRYYFDLDAVRIPNQILGITDFRTQDEISEKYQTAYRNQQRFNYRIRDAKCKKGQPQYKATEEEIRAYQKRNKNALSVNVGFSKRLKLWSKIVNTENSPIKNKIKYNIENRQKELVNNGVISSAQRIRGFYDTFGGQNHPKGKTLPSCWLIQSEPHNFSKELNATCDHFAAYPQALCIIPIIVGCPKNGIVLDPFAGSGTTGVVTQKLGRKFIGIELNQKYVDEIMIPRLQNAEVLL